MLVQATLETIKKYFGLNWEISCQGINVADAASGAGGDITVSSGAEVVMAIEITERTIDRNRLVSTFKSKIAPSGIVDYLFFTRSAPDPEAQKLADQYFAQGHEIGFREIKTWIGNILATVGAKGRSTFNAEIIHLLEGMETPKAVKVAWNEQVTRLAGNSQ